MRQSVWKNIIALLAALLVAALPSGCVPFSRYQFIRNAEYNQESTELPLTPVQSEKAQRQSYTLYFRYEDENYLAGEQRMLSASEDKRIEKVLLQDMIQNGPSAGSVKLKPVINPKTSVLSVSENREYLYITLSREFLEPISDEIPANWAGDEKWREQVYAERRLAVMAIVNTLTELGQYSRIQILVDTDNTGQGTRPTWEMLGFVRGDPEQDAQLAEPLSRDQSMVLTPRNTLNLLLKRFGEKNWKAVDAFIAQNDPRGYTKPPTEEMIAMLGMLDISLVSYEIHDEMVSNDGQSAVITVSYVFQLKDGNSFSIDRASMRMIRENSIWKMVYSSINQLISNA
ncbi:MAG: GerMN domain-containing protein [Christensenellales bacterium]|jgi:hypothetical protein